MRAFTLVLGASLAFAAHSQCIFTDFDSFPVYGGNGAVMFRQPSFSGSTAGFIVTDPFFNPTNLTQVSDRRAWSGSNSLEMRWRWTVAANAWLRLTTFNTPNLPNPAISDFTKAVVIFMYVTTVNPDPEFFGAPVPDLKVAIAVRETNSGALCGTNGGSANGIEFVRAEQGVSPPGGRVIGADARNRWLKIIWRPSTDTLHAFAGATANGILDFNNGTLEMIAFSPATPGDEGPYTVYIDNPGVYDLIAGDVDLNGCVDDTDLARVLEAFGAIGPFYPEDLNEDGTVDDVDLAIVLENFGAGC